MSKAILTKGLPASGKSTWSKKYCEEHPEWVRISRDDFRHMRGTYWRPKDEDLITKWEYSCIKEAIEYGKSVIIDEMNLNPKFRNRLEDYLKSLGVTDISHKEFLDVPLEELIRRDMQRPFSIGEKVIRQHYNKYIAKKVDSPVYCEDSTLPHAIICDLDGTLALFGDKNPYERDFINDELNWPVASIIESYLRYKRPTVIGSAVELSMETVLEEEKRRNPPRHLIVFSGRTDRFKKETLEWLEKHNIKPTIFDMRTKEEEGMQIKDVDIKRKMFYKHIKGRYYIDFVLDDRLQVCRLWHSLGLPLFRVGDPDADF